jgi:hypothetical protein
MAPRGRRPLLRRLLGALGAAPVLVCAIAVAGTWCAAARADDVAPPPPTTTIEAPPPDRYSPTPKPTPKPTRVAPVTHVAPRVTLPRYTPPAVVQSAPRPVAAKPVHKKVVVHKQRKRSRPVHVSLAPIAHIVAASRLPALPAPDGKNPYLWLAGLAFAVLALSGLSLQVLSVRYFRPELR